MSTSVVGVALPGTRQAEAAHIQVTSLSRIRCKNRLLHDPRVERVVAQPRERGGARVDLAASAVADLELGCEWGTRRARFMRDLEAERYGERRRFFHRALTEKGAMQ
jgi:hypothetical protein